MNKILTVLMVFAVVVAHATTHTIAAGDQELVVPAVVDLASYTSMPTNRVATQGRFVREGRIVRQYTANGWVVSPSHRSLIIIQLVGGDGSAVVSDGQGDLITLDGTVAAVVFTGEHAPPGGISIKAEGGGVTVFTSYR